MAATQEMIRAEAPAPFLSGEDLERFVVGGDLSVLPPEAKTQHYIAVCASLGVNPATKPFEYIRLNGKEVLYARRDCTDQLRKLHNVSVQVVARELVGDVYVVTARAMLANGRTDESIGALPVANLRGEALANAYMKAETKAKRRVTLSICGLGFFDESEVDSIEDDRLASIPQEAPPAEHPQPPPTPEEKKATRPAASRSKPKAAQDETGVPDVITEIPASLCDAILPFKELKGVTFSDMNVDDLEVVISVCKDFRPRATNERSRKWLIAIEATATVLHRGLTEADPPPADNADVSL